MRQYELIARVVDTALRQDRLIGIVEVLKEIAKSVDAYGCILWEAAPWSDLEQEPPTGELFVLASWFDDDLKLPLHGIPLVGSANGEAILTREAQNVEDMNEDVRTYKHSFIMDVARLVSMCAVPIDFDEVGPITDGAARRERASLSIYRKHPGPAFSPQDVDFIRQMARLVPPLYRALRDRVGRGLLESINAILDEAEQQTKTSEDPISSVKEVLNKVCRKVADTFQCVEVTLFLENRLQAEKVFKLFATTWPNWNREKDAYLPQKEEGLTGWVLENQQSVHIFDLKTFEIDKERLRHHYPDITWGDSLKIKTSASAILDLPVESLPPLSFMAVPITHGDKLLGVIRCCTARNAPWFFFKRQLNVLDLVAAQISRFWYDWLQHLEEQEENRSWQTLVDDISKLNATVQSDLNSPTLQDRLFGSVLNLARKASGADILDVRLLDDATQELYFAKWLGTAWTKGSKQEIAQRQNKRFSLAGSGGPGGGLGISVFKNGKADWITNAEQQGYRSSTFPETKRIVIAPIGVQKKTIGLLDMRGTGTKPFTAHALRVADLLGRQLGLYLALAQSERQQRQVFEDLWHQLKSPVSHTFARAQDLVQRMVGEEWHPSDVERADDIENKLRMLRGVARKAKRVAVSAGLFKDLASEGRLQLSSSRRKPLTKDKAISMLIEASMDTELALEDNRSIRCHVERDGFGMLQNNKVMVDLDLLDQAINCLLDNAGKYSFSGTRVIVTGGKEGVDGNDFFFISVKSVGLEITPNEVEKCKERYYRGDWARILTGEGSGIGLWVVDHIVRAHGGHLIISPTKANGVTEVKLLFPISMKG